MLNSKLLFIIIGLSFIYVIYKTDKQLLKDITPYMLALIDQRSFTNDKIKKNLYYTARQFFPSYVIIIFS